jgi:hypothetical protein
MSQSNAGHRIRLRVAGVLSLILGLGFGIPAGFGAWYFGIHGQVWQFLGNPTNGDGPFVQWGVPNSVPLMVAFVMVCTADVVCGALLLALRRVGVVLAVVLLPIELVFWIGFLLPFAFPLGIARVVLVLWPSTSGSPRAV